MHPMTMTREKFSFRHGGPSIQAYGTGAATAMFLAEEIPALLTFLNSHPGVSARWINGEADVEVKYPDVDEAVVYPMEWNEEIGSNVVSMQLEWVVEPLTNQELWVAYFEAAGRAADDDYESDHDLVDVLDRELSARYTADERDRLFVWGITGCGKASTADFLDLARNRFVELESILKGGV